MADSLVRISLVEAVGTVGGVQADSWGVSYGYTDADGEFHQADPEVRRAIHRAMGAPDDGSGGPGTSTAVHVLTPVERFGPSADTDVTREDGSVVGVKAGSSLSWFDLGAGYHRAVNISTGHSTSLVATPGECHIDADLKAWGWAVQLYAMRSTDSWGFGDFRDLRRLNDWSARHGSSMVLINPLHAPSPVASPQPSPYFPTSRIAKSPLHICIEEVPGWERADPSLRATAALAKSLNNDRRIDRDKVYAAKIEALNALWANFPDADPDLHVSFDAFVASRGTALHPIATFFALVELHGGDWRSWPSALRDSKSSDVAAFAANNERIRFHLWVQWLCDRQLTAAGQVGADRFDVMTDLAIGVDRAGADAWVNPSAFCLDMSVGAPPDTFNQLGQNWGLPPFNPWQLREIGYEPFIQTVRAAMSGAGALRMDHVMGLFRLYWIPEGASPQQGCYVYLPFRDLLGIVALESVRANAYVVGEDLGTVEPYVREELSKARIYGYQLLQFEPGPAAELRHDVLAAVTTHDLPTVPGLWTGSDTQAQLDLKLAPNVEGVAAVRTSVAARAGVDPNDPSVAIDTVVLGVYRDLATAPCAVINATLDDALGVEERPNMPGTIDEWPNWRIALPVSLEAILDDPRVAAVAAALNRP
jgi:4-alpha-glucanotransferase